MTLSGRDLSPEDVEAIARCERRVAIADEALRRIRAAHDAIERAVADNAPVYGVTTGLGARVTTRLEPEPTATPPSARSANAPSRSVSRCRRPQSERPWPSA